MCSAASSGRAPIKPIYPFNQPGESLCLYEGMIGGLGESDVQGKVELSLGSGPRIEWSAESDVPLRMPLDDSFSLILHKEYGDARLPVYLRSGGWMHQKIEGGSNGASFGDESALLKRMVVHWFNLPNMNAKGPLELRGENGGHRLWRGRWTAEMCGWKITLDVRPDHQKIWRDFHKSAVYVMTHVMEVRRAGAASFSAAEAKSMLNALHFGISFAMGRWAAPMLPVGENDKGEVVWEEWRPLICDRARSITSGWWYDQDLHSLETVLDLVIEEFLDPVKRRARGLQLQLAISAMSDQGFVEQRITTGTAGLEHIMWQELVLSERMTKKQYKGKETYQGKNMAQAHERLRLLLGEAKIPLDVKARTLPAAAAFISDATQHQNNVRDGADLVPYIRNRLVHPEGGQEKVYDTPRLVVNVWLLTRHYLVLLILNSLGYCGQYRDLVDVSGYASATETVYWAR